MGGPVRPADNPRMHLTSPTFHRPHGGGRSIARGGGARGPGMGRRSQWASPAARPGSCDDRRVLVDGGGLHVRANRGPLTPSRVIPKDWGCSPRAAEPMGYAPARRRHPLAAGPGRAHTVRDRRRVVDGAVAPRPRCPSTAAARPALGIMETPAWRRRSSAACINSVAMPRRRYGGRTDSRCTQPRPSSSTRQRTLPTRRSPTTARKTCPRVYTSHGRWRHLTLTRMARDARPGPQSAAASQFKSASCASAWLPLS